jgi:hypothetical protein
MLFEHDHHLAGLYLSRPYSVKHQMFSQLHANYYALDTHALSLPCVPLNIHEALDFPDGFACTPGRSISASHWMHARYAPISHLYNVGTKR